MPLIPVWDAVAFAIWLTSFTRNSIRWRGADYYIRGRWSWSRVLSPTSTTPASTASVPAVLRAPIVLAARTWPAPSPS